MKTTYLISILILLGTWTVNGQNTFQRIYGGTDDDHGRAVIQTTDSGFAFVGNTFSYGNDFQIYFAKTDSFGDTLWLKILGGSGEEVVRSIQQTVDGGYIIVGSTKSFGAGGYDVYLIKTDSNGDTLWTKTFGGNGDDQGWSITQTTDTGYIITGLTNSYGAGDNDIYLIKTDRQGDTLWTKTFGGIYDDRGHSVLQTMDGKYIIAGATKSYGAGDFDYYIIKTNSSGDTLWTKVLGTTDYDALFAIKETSNADYIATGIGDFITFGYRAPLIKIDSSGNLLWKKEIGFGLVDTYGNSLIITNNNEYVIGGEDNDFFGYDALIFKTDSNGNVLWYQYHGGDKTNDGAKSVVSTPDGGYVLLGWTEESEGGGVYDIFMVKTDNNGCSPSAKAGQDLVICKNASIQLNARGMNKDDTYSWNPAAGLSNSTIYNPMATPLVTTQYILTVSSSCATAEDTILITVNPLPTITVSADTTICPGDSASLTATGGSSYLWSPQSGLNNNAISNPKTSPSTTVTYTVMVTDTNSCMNSATVKVSLHTTPSVTFQGLDSTYCLDAPNDSLQGTPANGLFSGNGMTGNIFNPATAGVGTHLIYYSYTDSNNCVLTDTQNTVILSLDTPGIFVIGSLDFCDGDSVQIYEFIFPDYCDFLWSTGDTTDYLVIYTPGNYSVIVSGNGVNCPNCPTSSDSVTVIINPDPPKPVLTQSGNNLTCSVAGMTYEWYLNNVPLFGPNVQTYTATQSGLYHVMITDTNGCQSFSDTVSVTTYIWELSDQGHVQIYPNPFHYYTTVYIPEIFIKNKVLSLEIYNLFGRLVGKQVLNKEQTIIDRNSFSNGCYLFRILENSGELGHGVVMIY